MNDKKQFRNIKEEMDNAIFQVLGRYDDDLTEVIINILSEKVDNLKSRISKYIILDGYMDEDTSMNLIIDEIFGDKK